MATFKFMELAAEVREAVYDAMMPGLEIFYGPSANINADADPPKYRYGIVVANKQISEEFLDFVYRRATFTFKVTRLNTCDFRAWPRITAHPDFLRNVRKCKFLRDYNDVEAREFSTPYVLDRELHLPSIIQQLPKLRKLSTEVVLAPHMVEVENAHPKKDKANEEPKASKPEISKRNNEDSRQEPYRSVLWSIPIEEFRSPNEGCGSYLF